MTDQFLLVILFVLVGAAAGYTFRIAVAMSRRRSLEQQAADTINQSELQAKKILNIAESKAEQLIKDAKQEEREIRQDLKQAEDRLITKENTLDQRSQTLDTRETQNNEFRFALEEIKIKIKEKEVATSHKLSEIAQLSPDQAKEELMERIKNQHSDDLLRQIQKFEQTNKEHINDKAKMILASAVQRLAASTAQELTTTSVSIPSEEIKGKIIGREGRNIRAFERAAGVELVIDDTPGIIVVSSFDPIRRQIAKTALENLLLDGRIQPVKIEEFVNNARHEINKIIKQKGEQAVYELGIIDFDTRIVAILGRLHFRTSYGQNVLQHSIEMAHIAGMIAEEIGANVYVAKAASLVHDIGKALDHEMPGGHVKIGMRVLEKFGADSRIITAMKSHHDDWPHETVEAVIVQAADHISGGRPGARRDSVENYLKRLQELENVANGFPGVDKSYALQAGREIRVFVHPGAMNDFESKELARNIANKIEQELKYPGEIKITVIRETRIIQFAR